LSTILKVSLVNCNGSEAYCLTLKSQDIYIVGQTNKMLSDL